MAPTSSVDSSGGRNRDVRGTSARYRKHRAPNNPSSSSIASAYLPDISCREHASASRTCRTQFGGRYPARGPGREVNEGSRRPHVTTRQNYAERGVASRPERHLDRDWLGPEVSVECRRLVGSVVSTVISRGTGRFGR